MSATVPLKDTCTSFQNLSYLDFDLSRLLKAKPDGAAGFPVYVFVLVYINSDTSLTVYLFYALDPLTPVCGLRWFR